MYKPRFKILKKNFSDRFTCLGSQLITIIHFLQEILGPHVWYVGNIEANNETSYGNRFDSFSIEKLGSDSSLIQLCSETDQFLSGVFIAVNVEYAEQEIKDIELGTEDEEFRPLNMRGVLIEIRAFDTFYFEIYSENEKIIRELGKKLDLDEMKVLTP